jgi:hypothetical protein
MKHTALALALVLGACTAAPPLSPVSSREPVTPTSESPAASVPASFSPASTPTSTPGPRLPLALEFEFEAVLEPGFVARVVEGAATWNQALGRVVFASGPDAIGPPLPVGLLGEGLTLSSDLEVIGEELGADYPVWVRFVPRFIAQHNTASETLVLHELGHALGLSHSERKLDVMYPINGYARGLSANDIARARSAVLLRDPRP